MQITTKNHPDIIAMQMTTVHSFYCPAIIVIKDYLFVLQGEE